MHLPQPQLAANRSQPRSTEPATPRQVDAADHDWLEFLALGLRRDPLQPVAGQAWRQTPVLLSY